MNISVGIVGLPNVGKSTLFNALLKKQQALAANYPFATIEPNVGIVGVPDGRLEKLAEVVALEETSPSVILGIRQLAETPESDAGQASMTKKPPIKPATVEFVDIAGLVKGASEGAGLGNKFLSHIREVKVIAHVVRAFEDNDIVREGSVGVKEDYETIQTELILADLNTLSKIKEQKSKIQIKGQKEAAEKLFEALNNGKAAREVSLNDDEQEAAKQFFLLTAKPEMIVLNVEENALNNAEEIIQNYAEKLGLPVSKFVVICAKVESELAALSDEEQKEYLKELGVEKSGLEYLIQKAYEELGLISFLTAGEKEVRAWTLRRGETALRASGEIHTDFMNHFIKAEIVSYDDYVASGGRKKAREVGKARLEGKDYIVKDGDVIEFKIGS